MNKEAQKRAPFVEALEAYCAQHMQAYHTPGHKLGRGISSYQKALFGDALRRDLGLMYALDDLFQPEGSLKEAMDLAADLYGAGRTFFSINGTTGCIEAMLLAVCHEGDDVLIPREAHKSILNGLILSGAKPVYMESRFAEKEQVSLGPDLASLQKALVGHPQAKAVVFTYPTYDGIAGNLEEMTAYAHEKGLYVLVDEAHGAHLAFHEDLPKDALACGADCVAQSTHKLAGSLTQTSMLHCRKGFPLTEQVAAAMAVVQSTSPHYWFLASLDDARRQMALEGPQLLERTLELARKVRTAINAIPGLASFGREITRYDAVGDFDETKITIDFSGLGLSGKEAERRLRQEGIEVELVAGSHVLALLTIGDDETTAAALVGACHHIAAACGTSRRGANPSDGIRRQLPDTGAPVARPQSNDAAYSRDDIELAENEQRRGAPMARPPKARELPLPAPDVVITPRRAWNSATETIPLAQSLGRIAAETVTFYPPGIPVVARGERLTQAVLAYIREKMRQGYTPNGPADGSLQTIRVLKEDDHE